MTHDPAVFKLSPLDAIQYTKNWRDQPHENPNYAKAFTVHIEELEQILLELKQLSEAHGIEANAVRFYIAEKPISIGNPNDLKETLILVGVKDFHADENPIEPGKDILTFDPGNPGDLLLSGCYDFTYPCPDTCATDSPLFSDNNKIWNG